MPTTNQSIELAALMGEIADAVVAIDQGGLPFRRFQPGVGPYGEPQLVGQIAAHLRGLPKYGANVEVRRTPDLLVRGLWALEFKLARPFGDNGREAENWSVNLLHPYEGNVSAIGDCLKLSRLTGPERKVCVVIGYEHTPAEIFLEPLFASLS